MTDRKPRVLHVIDRISGHGGAEVSLNQMLVRLQRMDVDNVLIGLTTPTDETTVEALERAGVRVLPTVGSTGPAALVRLISVIRRERPTVVHTSLFLADLWGRCAATVTRTPGVVSIVNTQYDARAYDSALSPRRLRVVQALDGLLARHLTTAVHAISETTAQAGIRDLGIPASRIWVVPRGRELPEQDVRSQQAKDAARARAGLPQHVPLVLNVARLEPQKGQLQLIDAFARLLERAPDAVLAIAGRRGTASAEIQRRIELRRLEDRVLLLGARKDVPDLLRSADAFAFASRWEGLAGSVLEAMAHGVPVVAFDIDAVRETTGGHAALVAVDDVDGFADALAGALSDQGASAARAADARARAASVYDPAAVTEAMAALYARLTERGSRRVLTRST